MNGLTIKERRDYGYTWQQIADYCGYGSESSARRAGKREAAKARAWELLTPTNYPVDGSNDPNPFLKHDTLEIKPVLGWRGSERYVDKVGGGLKHILFVGDVHAPYHNKKSWDIVKQVGRDLGPDGIVGIGDLTDLYGVSSHSKSPLRNPRLDMEIAKVTPLLDDLDAMGASWKIYVGGNHEDRLARYLADRAPELYGIMDVPSLLNLTARGWEYVPYKKHTQIGKLFVTHDVNTAGRNAVFKALDMFFHSVVTGHTHRLQYVVEGDATGGSRVSAAFGWLGDVEQVDYMHDAQAKKNWAQGFGVGYLDESTGVVYLVPVPIVNGTAVFNGKLYKGQA